MREAAGLWLAVGLALFAACSSATESGTNGTGGSGAVAGDASVGGAAGASGAGGAPVDAGPDVTPATTVVVIGPGADQDAPSKFNGAVDPYQKIELVYPSDGTLVPPNLNSLEFHFKPGTGQDLFEIRFLSAPVEYIVYVGCTQVSGGCAFATDKQFWDQLVGPNRKMPPVYYSIRGTNKAKPTTMGVSDPRTIAFAQDDIVGGLYYWNAGGGVIERYDFGLPLQAPEQFMTAPMAGALVCVGCHGLSRDGKRMAIGADIPAPAPYKVYDVATKTALPTEGGTVSGAANFFSFDPTGKKLLFSDGNKTGLQDVATGTIENASLIPVGTMPDWGPSGSLIVYAASSQAFPFGNPGVSSARLEIVQYTNGSVGAPSVLVPFQGQNNYYPAFDPTEKWVAFNRSPSNMDSYSAGPPSGDGELWAARVQTGDVVRLDKANGEGKCSWPKWAPDISSYYGGSVVWLTVSSARAYGLKKTAGGTVQLWMAGFDPGKIAAGEDPSFPAFWFPYQDLGSGNHIAQWVTTVERKPCLSDTDCDGTDKCVAGKCIPVIK
jgi:hypothetical protein